MNTEEDWEKGLDDLGKLREALLRASWTWPTPTELADKREGAIRKIAREEAEAAIARMIEQNDTAPRLPILWPGQPLSPEEVSRLKAFVSLLPPKEDR